MNDKYKEPHGSKQRVEEQLRIALDGHPDSQLWGDDGLLAATMRCVYGYEKLERERDEARREAEKYRNLSCEDQDEADETLLPWEKQPTSENMSKNPPHPIPHNGVGIADIESQEEYEQLMNNDKKIVTGAIIKLESSISERLESFTE
jgi:hypothetical protein